MPDHKRINDVGARAIRVFGSGPQTDQAVEECAEFIVAVRHFMRGKATTIDLYEEIADVTIMMAQMRLMVGAAPVDRAIAAKLDRLEARLDAKENDDG